MRGFHTFRRKTILFLYTAGLLSASLLAAGCVSGGGYNSPWTYKSSPAPAAPQAQTTVPAATTLAQSMNTPPQTQAAPYAAPAAAAIPPEGLPPVKVAILLPLTGPHQELGQSMLNAAQIALFDIGYGNFQLVPHDTAATSQGGAQAAQAAIQGGASLILGPVFADSVRGAKAVAAQAGINIVAFSTDWTLADGRTFLMGFLPFGQVERVTSFAAAQGLTKMAVLAPQDAYGQAALQGYKNIAPRIGVQTISEKTFNPASTTLADEIKAFAQYDQRSLGQSASGQTQIAPPPFDSVFIPAGGDTARSLSNLMNGFGLPANRVKRLGTGLWDDPLLGQYQEMEGAWFAAPSPNLRKDFEGRYRELHGVAPVRLATLAYDATALAAVLAQTGLQSTGRPAFDAPSITNPNGFAGIDGIFRFRSNGLVERGLAVLEFRRGQIAVVDEAPRSFENAQSF